MRCICRRHVSVTLRIVSKRLYIGSLKQRRMIAP